MTNSTDSNVVCTFMFAIIGVSTKLMTMASLIYVTVIAGNIRLLKKAYSELQRFAQA